MRALLRKEFMETIRWAPLGWLLILGLLFIVWQECVRNLGMGVAYALLMSMSLGSAAIAVGLGLLQSSSDQRNGARAYLLHRAVSTSQVFWAKVIVGATIFAIVCLVPLAFFAAWLQMRGVMYQATRGIQAIPAAIALLNAFTFYFAMFSVVCRPANWIGSRALPLLGAVLLQAFLNSIVNSMWDGIWIATAISVIANLIFALAARHAFVEESTAPSAAHARRSWAQTVVLAGSCAGVFVTAAFVVVMTLIPTTLQSSGSYVTVEITQDGQPWHVTQQNGWSEEDQGFAVKIIAGSPIVPDKTADPKAPLTSKLKPLPVASLSLKPRNASGHHNLTFSMVYDENFSGRWNKVEDVRGYLLYYNPYHHIENRPPLTMVASRSGIHLPSEPWGTPFRERGSLSVTVETDGDTNRVLRPFTLLADADGVYQLRETTRTVHRLVDQPTISAYVIAGDRTKLFVRGENQVSIFELLDESGQPNWTIPVPAPGEKLVLTEAPPLSARLIETIDVPASMRNSPSILVGHVDKGQWTMMAGNYGTPSLIARRTAGSTDVETYRGKLPLQDPPLLFASCMSLLAPPAMMTVAAIGAYIQSQEIDGETFFEALDVGPVTSSVCVLLIVLQVVASLLLTRLAANHRKLSRNAKTAWSSLSILLGLSTPLALLASYPRIVKVACGQCRQPRRVDLAQCEHCNAPWPRPERNGIEIFLTRQTAEPVEVN